MQERGLERVATFDQKHFRRFEHLEIIVPGVE